MTETSDRTGGPESRFPRHPRSVGRARAALRAQLSAWGVAGDAADNAELLISELMTNAVRHAQAPPGREIAARFALTEGRLLLEVSDAGERLPVPTQAPPDAENGRGLALVAALAHDWGVRPRDGVGKCVWALLDLAPGLVPVPPAGPAPDAGGCPGPVPPGGAGIAGPGAGATGPVACEPVPSGVTVVARSAPPPPPVSSPSRSAAPCAVPAAEGGVGERSG
ncbi:ATP-binding protein [Streptomyces zingiberis]|uniref:ATP-binding protein n=1 Tax=Streptomyces zingiberis TaxID=2053010 RepID=A0ABX1C1V4_9ACTN|nr:ATP-binding protein [Streptomyces zingiberis]NJQ02568.1 ATP-binding protein [Streptomyces zingiberis]